MARQPPSVTRATALLGLLMVLALAVTVLAVVFDDDLVTAWRGGRERSADDTTIPPSFTPVVVVLFVVFVGLTLTLLALLRSGHNWARHCLAAMMVFIMLATISGLRTSPPAVFVVCSAVSLLIDAAILFYLWHRDTSRYVGRPPSRSADGSAA